MAAWVRIFLQEGAVRARTMRWKEVCLLFLRTETRLERLEQSKGGAWEETWSQRQWRPVGMVSQARQGLGVLFRAGWEPLESSSREVAGSDILLQNYSDCSMENRIEGTRVEGRRIRRLLGYSRYKMALPEE